MVTELVRQVAESGMGNSETFLLFRLDIFGGPWAPFGRLFGGPFPMCVVLYALAWAVRSDPLSTRCLAGVCPQTELAARVCHWVVGLSAGSQLAVLGLGSGLAVLRRAEYFLHLVLFGIGQEQP